VIRTSRTRRATTEGDHAEGSDPLDVIEMAAAALVRNFELLRRRSDIYTELDQAEYLLLRTLHRIGPADICTLATALGLDPSTAGRQVAAIQAKGLVARQPASTDRRRSIVSPTEEGHRRMTTTRDRRRDSARRILAGWSEDDLHTLGEMFTRYNEAVADTYLRPTTDRRD
jgi:DNA-binding MarR family transcriptional regulator